MPTSVHAPDGSVVNFPDGMSEAAIEEAMRRNFPPQQPHKMSFGDVVRGTAQGAQALGNSVSAAAQGAIGAVPFLSDVQAGMNTALDPHMWSGKASPAQAFQNNRQAIEDLKTAHPMAAALGNAAGTTATLAIPGMEGSGLITKAPAGATMGAKLANTGMNVARGATAAGTSGAVYGLGSDGDIQQRLEQGTKGAELGAVLGGALGGIAGRVGNKSAPTVRPQVQALLDEGVRVTPGQKAGGLAKALEDTATSLPIAGQAIQDARRTGLEDFNRAAVNRSLREIGKALPDGVVGNSAIDYAQKAFGEKYDAIIPNKTVVIDEGVRDAVNAMAPDIALLNAQNRQSLINIIRSTAGDRVEGGALTGEAFKRVQSQLRTKAEDFAGSTDPDHKAMGRMLQTVKGALQDAAGRQDPAFARDLSKIDLGYAGFKQVQNAAARATSDGVFTPSQYAFAIRSADKSADKGRFAAGNALNQDFAQAGQAVLPSKLPDSGTAGRLAAMGLLDTVGGLGGHMVAGDVGAMGGLLAAHGATAAAGGALAKGYSPAALAAYNEAIRGKDAGLKALRDLAAQDPQAQRLYQDAVMKLSRGLGAVSASAMSAQ